MTVPTVAIQILLFFVGAGGSALIAWGVSKQIIRDLREKVQDIERTIYPGDGTCSFVTRADIRDHRGYIFVTHYEFQAWKEEICRKVSGIRDLLKEMDKSRNEARKTTEDQNVQIQKSISRIETLIDEIRKDRERHG